MKIQIEDVRFDSMKLAESRDNKLFATVNFRFPVDGIAPQKFRDISKTISKIATFIVTIETKQIDLTEKIPADGQISFVKSEGKGGKAKPKAKPDNPVKSN